MALACVWMISDKTEPRRNRIRRPSRGWGLALACFLPVLGACSSGSGQGAAASSTTSVSARQKPAAPKSASALRHQPPDPCALLGDQDIDALVGSVVSKDSVRPEATIGSPNRDCIWYGKAGAQLTVTVLTDASLKEYSEHSKDPVTLQSWFSASQGSTQIDLGMPDVKMAKGLVAPTARHVVLLYGTLLIDVGITTTTGAEATDLPELDSLARLIATRAETRWPTLVTP